MQQWQSSLLGGALIGLSSSIMLLSHGRITGISGILNTALSTSFASSRWRYIFLLGMVVGGIIMGFLIPGNIFITQRHPFIYLAAGLLVGFGTTLGSGCTSGHGVCGISRFSKRSLAATIIFMVFGMLTTYISRSL